MSLGIAGVIFATQVYAESPNLSNPNATFDLGLGTISRGNSNAAQYEYAAQQWADITDTNGSYGVSVMNDCKYGWDKPNDNTLRLTIINTPLAATRYTYESVQDLGKNNFKFSLTGHTGSWSETPNEAATLNQPLLPFAISKHDGAFGKELSFVSVNNS